MISFKNANKKFNYGYLFHTHLRLALEVGQQQMDNWTLRLSLPPSNIGDSWADRADQDTCLEPGRRNSKDI